MESKQDIRRNLLKKRNTLTEELREKYSKMIADHLFSSDQYIHSDILLIYAHYKSEVSTSEIIEQALYAGKRVFCPKVLGPGEMNFYEITSLKDIVSGYKNIPEPQYTEISYQNSENSSTLMIMPLVGYDCYKNRLGYGGGFYDRYLQKVSNIKKIALAFECQKSENAIPVEETDIKPDFIITEQQIY